MIPAGTLTLTAAPSVSSICAIDGWRCNHPTLAWFTDGPAVLKIRVAMMTSHVAVVRCRRPLTGPCVFECCCESTARGQLFQRYADMGPQGRPPDIALSTELPSSARVH